jgi:hypothetical protein
MCVLSLVEYIVPILLLWPSNFEPWHCLNFLLLQRLLICLQVMVEALVNVWHCCQCASASKST